MSDDPTSFDSLDRANRNRSRFVEHHRVLGAAGYVDPHDQSVNVSFLGQRKDSLCIDPPESGFFSYFHIGAAWDNQFVKDQSLVGKILNKKVAVNIDLDLGILYEFKDGRRGAVQALGKQMGRFEEFPYLSLSGDEQTGDKEGDDEYIRLNTKYWSEFKRVLIYVYIYRGAKEWGDVAPQVHIHIPQQPKMVVSLTSMQKGLGVCAVAEIENARGGLKITNYSEYFAGQAEMDRAFGYGIEWIDGHK